MVVSNVINLSDIKSYSSIKKNLEGKKHSLQFLPISLEKISKQINFKTKYNLKDGIEEILLFLKKNINENFDNKKYSNT